jgi:hypothetical protein
MKNRDGGFCYEVGKMVQIVYLKCSNLQMVFTGKPVKPWGWSAQYRTLAVLRATEE